MYWFRVMNERPYTSRREMFLNLHPAWMADGEYMPHGFGPLWVLRQHQAGEPGQRFDISFGRRGPPGVPCVQVPEPSPQQCCLQFVEPGVAALNLEMGPVTGAVVPQQTHAPGERAVIRQNRTPVA